MRRTEAFLPVLLAAAGAAAPAARAQDAPERASVWVRQGSSLLFFDSQGALAQEIGLRADDESLGPRTSFSETRGGVSPGGRFAWVLDKTTRYDSRRTHVVDVQSELRVYGTNGKRLWSLRGADAPRGLEPVYFSADGETAAVLARGEGGWFLFVRSFLGAPLAEAGPFDKVQGAGLTPNGRYAFARWLVLDKSATHTFLEVPTKRRVDLASGDLFLGLARVTNEGVVISGQKTVFDFNEAAKERAPSLPEEKP